jgi:phosphoenolpyruvate carboxykinase (GTP)
MAMKPFCGYHFGDYWQHWLSFEQRLVRPPKLFHVNWFRKDAHGQYLWPGFGDNLRVLEWIVERCEDRVGSRETAIGFLPRREDLALQGLNLRPAQLEELLSLDPFAWKQELSAIGSYLDEFRPRVPARLRQEHVSLMQRLCEHESPVDREAEASGGAKLLLQAK